MTYFEISNSDKVSKKSNIRQLVDILQVDIASKYDTTTDGVTTTTSTNTRKKYEVFVSGGLETSGSVTSSLYQTVFDQDHSFQTSNEMLDITIGSHLESTTVTGLSPTEDASGKLVFSNDTLMMREKIYIYQQYAQSLLGNATSYFYTPFEATDDVTKKIEDAVFINFKRLFVRDGLEKEQFSIKIHKSLDTGSDASSPNIDKNISRTDTFNLYSDAGASSNLNVSTVSGQIGSIVDDNNTQVGLIFYNKGIVVLDAKKIFAYSETVYGSISSVNTSNSTTPISSSLIPGLWTSGSIDDIIDHIADTRFGRDNRSAIGYINQTSINSMIYFCRVGPNDANFSTNPTYIDSDGNIMSIQDRGDDPFSYVTTVGLYDASNELLAVAKTSRPIEKNPEVDLSISVRLDY